MAAKLNEGYEIISLPKRLRGTTAEIDGGWAVVMTLPGKRAALVRCAELEHDNPDRAYHVIYRNFLDPFGAPRSRNGLVDGALVR